jgi:MipA family protein
MSQWGAEMLTAFNVLGWVRSMNKFCLRVSERYAVLDCASRSILLHGRRSTLARALGLVLPLASLTLNIQPAAAQASPEASDAQPTAVEPNAGAAVPGMLSDQWHFLLGAGAINAPRYPGSRDDFTRGLPLASLSYGRYFIGGVPGGAAVAGVGAYLVKTEHWSVGLDVGADARKLRRASDDPVLHGWGDIPGTANGGIFASYNLGWLSAQGSVSVRGHDEGTVASLGVEAKYQPIERLTLTIGPKVTWVNQQYAMTFFGVDAAQREIGGIAPHRARSGINTVGGSAAGSFLLTKRWSLAAFVSYGRLQGDAATSPVTTDKNQEVFGAFVMYRFR